MNDVGNTNWPVLFPEDEVPGMIGDVLDACQNLARPSKTAKRPEEAISKQVFQRLRKLPKYRSGPLEPHLESWLPDLDARADIRFSCGRGLDTYFVFEAKRLFVTYPLGKKDSLVRGYVREGMMRFVSGKYAPFQQASAMLGYVHDATGACAREALAVEIGRNAEELRLVRGVAHSLISSRYQVDDSLHRLDHNREFLIYHLLVLVPE